MIKLLTQQLDYGFFAEVALVIFALVFVAVVVRTLRTQGEVTDRQANIVLDEMENQR